jgi:hypothetical protein
MQDGVLKPLLTKEEVKMEQAWAEKLTGNAMGRSRRLLLPSFLSV